METIAAYFSTAGSTAAAGQAATAAAAAGTGSAAAGAIGAGGYATTAGLANFSASAGLLDTALTAIKGFDWLSIATHGLTAFSALSSISSGNMRKAALDEQSLFEDAASRQELIKGRKEAVDMLSRLNDTIENNIVSTAASGITGEGSPAAASEAAIEKGNFEIGITRDNAIINAGARLARSRQLKIEANSARTEGFTRAAGAVALDAAITSRRG